MCNVKFNMAASVVVFCLASLPAFDAFAQGPTGTKADYGSYAPQNSADETIVLKPESKWVTVDDGETVKFVIGKNTFTWNFSTFHQPLVLSMAAIAPENIGTANIRIYVRTNPLYRYR